MRKSLIVAVVLIGIVFIVFIVRGFLFNQDSGKELKECMFAYVFLDVPIDKDGIESLNISLVLPKLKELNYSVKDYSYPNQIDYYIYDSELDLHLINNLYKKQTCISVKEHPDTGKTKNEVKNNLRKKVDKIANICSLTIHWSEAKWQVLPARRDY